MYFYKKIIFSLKRTPMLQKTSIAEFVFWLLFVSLAFEFNVHFSFLILPGVISVIESLLNNYHKNIKND